LRNGGSVRFFAGAEGQIFFFSPTSFQRNLPLKREELLRPFSSLDNLSKKDRLSFLLEGRFYEAKFLSRDSTLPIPRPFLPGKLPPPPARTLPDQINLTDFLNPSGGLFFLSSATLSGGGGPEESSFDALWFPPTLSPADDDAFFPRHFPADMFPPSMLALRLIQPPMAFLNRYLLIELRNARPSSVFFSKALGRKENPVTFFFS